MDARIFKVALFLGVAFLFAVYLGVAVATARLEALAWVAGGSFLFLCLVLGRHIWILIPATIGMQGGLAFIPGNPQPWQFMTAVVGFFFLLRWSTRQQPLRFRWTGLDTAVLLVALTILQAFLRNPTGLSVLGGSVAGGRPYIVFAIAVTAYILLGLADADFRSWRWAVLGYIFCTFVDRTVLLWSGISPKFAQVVFSFYTNVSFAATYSLDYSTNVLDTRITEFGGLGSLLGLIACTFWRPVAALDLTKPWRALVAGSAVVLTLLGGFRGALARLYVNFSIGSLLRRKPLDVIVVSFVSVILVAVVITSTPTASLPYTVQRLLTMVPGVRVRSDIEQSAKASSELRFEMWKLALTSDRYIHNKLLGDGFQYSSAELAARQARVLGDLRLTGGMTTQEMFMATGSYHGFHAETIRFTGVVGLLAATVALVTFAVFAMRAIRHYRDSRYWGFVLFLCMPFLIHPFWYWLVFGAYRSDFIDLIAMAGMLKIIEQTRLSELRQTAPATAVPSLDTKTRPALAVG